MNDNTKAAAILRQYAGELYQGHTIGGEWDGEHIKAEHDELMALADRLAQGGEAVAYRDEAGTLYPCAESVRNYMPKGRTATPLYTHPAPTDSGRVAELEAQLARVPARAEHVIHAQADRIAALEQQLTESREREGRMREALTGMLEIHGVTQRYADTHIEIPQSWVDSSEIARKALAADKEKNDA